MSWLKNVMKMFGSHENDEQEENEHPSSNHYEKTSGQIETKVTYQYPKGNFRFPLNLDHEHNKIPNEHKTKANRTKDHLRNSEVVMDSTIEKPIEKPILKHATLERSLPKIQPKIKQPFRPTEIPSPVYGFHKPPRRNRINKDLTQKAPQPNDTVSTENKSGNETVYRNAIDHSQKENGSTLKKQEIREYLDGSQQNTILSSFAASEEMDKTMGEGSIEDTADIRHEQSEETSINESSFERELEEDIDSFDSQFEDTYVKETLEPIKDIEESKWNHDFKEHRNETGDSLVSLRTSDETMEENAFGKPSDAEDFEPVLKENEQSMMDDCEESYLRQHEHQSESLLSDNDDIDTSSQFNKTDFESAPNQSQINILATSNLYEENAEDLQAEDVKNAEEENILSEERESNDASGRTHIPFNVIMLKKDREKLSSRQVISQTEIQNASKEIAASSSHDDQEYIEEDYVFPSESLLNPSEALEMDKQWVISQSELLDETLINFNVKAKVVNVSQGPSVTRFEVQPEPGVKVSKITNLSDDIKLSLAAKDIRIEAPIPGKHTIGIELPNAKSRPVYISEIISSEIFQMSNSPLTAALGLDISGKPIITDLRKMPHGLIAGATGSGKSVCINSILVSLLYKSNPDELKLLMIDPKMVELAPYNHIPHLVSPVITDVKAATAALKWAVDEMERRYELFAHTGVREIQRYNELAEQSRQFNQKLPFIVIVIDELADLMMMAPSDVEDAICRIAQKARACGIHLIIATQRPSVDVITGLIKANVPTRIAFSVSSQIDSRTIIDISGAEKLLGRGDMLFLENGSSKPVRLQGTYVSDQEIDKVVAHVRSEKEPNYLFEQEELLKKAITQDEEDEIFQDVCEFVMEQGAASTSLIQRHFRIGYNRAARLIELMEQQGIISEAKGSKPRDILISREEYETLMGSEEMNV